MKQASIFFDRDKYFNNKPMTEYLMEFLLEQGVSGATMFRGETGFGKNHQIKIPGRLFSFDEPPMMITFFDEDERVNQTLTELRKKIKTGYIIVNQVEIWK